MRIASKMCLVYISLITIFTVSLMVVHCIPQSWIRDNVIKSAQIIKSEGFYPQFNTIYYYQLDNFTDALMLDIAISADNSHPIIAALSNKYYINKDEDFAYTAEKVARGEIQGLSEVQYSRYWHGNQLVLRPLLTIMPYNAIRILNWAVFSVLLIGLFLCLKRVSSIYMWFFIVSLLLVYFPIVPLSMQFSPCFYIAFIGMLLILKNPLLTNCHSNAFCTFFVLGGLTSFMDLLVTPQLTLGLPLLAYFLVRSDEKSVRLTLLLILFWGLGYASIWMSKWIIASILLGSDSLFMVVKKIIQRGGIVDDGGNSITMYSFIVPMLSKLMNFCHGILLYIALGLVLLLSCLYVKLFKGRDSFKENFHYLIIAAIVPVWFICLRNHSLEHIWFTWRAWAVTIFSLMIFIYNTTELKKNLSSWKR